MERERQYLTLEKKKEELYKAIQQNYYKAINARSDYFASLDTRDSALETFNLVLAKYENGLADITEYNESKNAYYKAECKLIQAKYEMLFSIEILNLYKMYK